MTNITVIKNKALYVGLNITGHAGYDDYGKDIVCAAASVLSINLANSIAQLTKAKFKCEIDEKSGDYSFAFTETYGDDANILFESCLLGLESIQNEYGDDFIQINYQEV